MKSPWVSDQMIWVAKECSRNDLSIYPGMFDSSIASHSCVGRKGAILLPNHTVYIQLWNKELLQHIEVHVTCNDSLDGRECSANLSSVCSIQNFHIPTVSHMFDNLVRILQSSHDYIMEIYLLITENNLVQKICLFGTGISPA
jgi:hypothetical protein